MDAANDADNLGEDAVVQPIRKLGYGDSPESGADQREPLGGRGSSLDGRINGRHEASRRVGAAFVVLGQRFRYLRIRDGAEADDAH